MRTIACEGYCPFLLLYFLVFVDNKMYICHTHLDGIISILFLKSLQHKFIVIYQSDEENAFNQIRTIEEDGKLWFCATDVARVLGYVNPRDAIIRYCKSMGVVIRAPLQLVAFKK